MGALLFHNLASLEVKDRDKVQQYADEGFALQHEKTKKYQLTFCPDAAPGMSAWSCQNIKGD